MSSKKNATNAKRSEEKEKHDEEKVLLPYHVPVDKGPLIEMETRPTPSLKPSGLTEEVDYRKYNEIILPDVPKLDRTSDDSNSLDTSKMFNTNPVTGLPHCQCIQPPMESESDLESSEDEDYASFRKYNPMLQDYHVVPTSETTEAPGSPRPRLLRCTVQAFSDSDECIFRAAETDPEIEDPVNDSESLLVEPDAWRFECETKPASKYD